MVELGEQCDDGNLINGDGCSNLCLLEGGSLLVVITEVVTDPQSDWSDSTNGGSAGLPFDVTPGVGVIDVGDEYIEITNVGAVPVSLNSMTLDMTDTSPEAYLIGSLLGGVVESYSVGANAFFFPAGAVLVIGDPTGDLEDDVFVELKSTVVVTVNDVEVGDTGEAGDGAPNVGANGASTGIADESIHRVPGSFTGDDATDFNATAGDPGV